MIIEIALTFAVVFQLIAFGITVSLIPKTRFNIAWISISIGFLLMALRRIDDVVYCFSPADNDPAAQTSNWLAVLISVFMLVAAIYIRQIFYVLDRVQSMRKLDEQRLLTAVIDTEEKERKRFSKELHDGLGPLLSAGKMTLSAINPRHLEAENTELLGRAEAIIDKVIETTRELADHLTPQVLERYGLKKAIQSFIRMVSDEQVQIKLIANPKQQHFRAQTEVVMYRVCCEFINNTLKHAKAKNIEIILTEHPGSLELIYEDDGIGMQVDEAASNGMGLTNIRSRIRSVNGTIDIISQPACGFYAHIKIPLE